jgi:hypothetical protein
MKIIDIANLLPSSTSSKNDFDFLEGVWNVKNRKLKTRLNNCRDWEEFESEIHMRKTLMGNIENYYATFNGEPFEGIAVRLFNPSTTLWTIYWIDNINPEMDKNPVVGSFENGFGKFYTNAVFNHKNILVIYQWNVTNPNNPIWSQAFSEDGGITWEWNWEMHLNKK